jgi:hypothetical protein
MVELFTHYLDEWEVFPDDIQPCIANSIRKKAILYAGWKVPPEYRRESIPRSNRYDPSDFADIITSQDVDNGGRYAHRSGHNSATVNKVLFYYSMRVANASQINFNVELFEDNNQSNRSTVSHLRVDE